MGEAKRKAARLAVAPMKLAELFGNDDDPWCPCETADDVVGGLCPDCLPAFLRFVAAGHTDKCLRWLYDDGMWLSMDEREICTCCLCGMSKCNPSVVVRERLGLCTAPITCGCGSCDPVYEGW